MTNNQVSSPMGSFDPRTILLLIVSFILMAALVSCRSTKQTSIREHKELITAQESVQTQTIRLDSVIRKFSIKADTLDFWIFDNTYLFGNEFPKKWPTITIPMIDSLPDWNDSIIFRNYGKDSTKSCLTASNGVPRIRTPTATKQTGLHIRAVGLEQNTSSKNGTEQMEQTTQGSQKELHEESFQSDQQEKNKRPRLLPILPILLVIFVVGGYIIHRNWPKIIKWFTRRT